MVCQRLPYSRRVLWPSVNICLVYELNLYVRHKCLYIINGSSIDETNLVISFPVQVPTLIIIIHHARSLRLRRTRVSRRNSRCSQLQQDNLARQLTGEYQSHICELIDVRPLLRDTVYRTSGIRLSLLVFSVFVEHLHKKKT